MAASSLASEPTQEVFSWLRTLPLAPEYHPTLAEFQDPISYIFKIEKEASKYGICKIVPPVQPSSKKTAISNLNKSLLARSSSADPNNPKSPPTFTTRQQQIGFCPRKPRPIQKPVWQSGEYYTFQEFEVKAKSFEKNYLKKSARKGSGGGGGLSPLEIETLYWKATVDKPFRVEYANDMPGSAFIPISSSKKKMSKTGSRETGEGVSLGETDWNMRGVARAKGSLLKFMKEEIPGVTSPMVYVAMMFSWFAWHVEDHDLHSLNYLHMGAGKTWYGVPRDAAVAFEEVIRVHGYGGEINPLVTFAVLGEKTTVMSPEVFINAGIPCCRLVQNAGEFVVTFPRAYHTGFSHGFNCGEATNIATPEWLRFAKEAAIRRASINYPPMVSHFQLLYDLALALCSRKPEGMGSEPRSSRLKDKKKSEGETVIKELFVQNMETNNELLHTLGKGSSVVLLPWNSADISVCSKLRVGSHLRGNPPSFPPLGLCSSKESIKSSILDQGKDFYPLKGTFSSSSVHSVNGNDYSSSSKAKTLHAEGLSDQRLFSCVTCGILNFDCLAVIQPKEEAARNLMSADCSYFNDWVGGSMLPHNGGVERSVRDDVNDIPVHTLDEKILRKGEGVIAISNNDALGLLASTYGNSSDSEEEDQAGDNTANLVNGSRSESKNWYENSGLPSTCNQSLSCSKVNGADEKFNCSGQLEPTDDNGDSNVISCSNAGKNGTQQDDKSAIVPMEKNKHVSFFSRSDDDSSRLHVFCLEHAVEVEQQLQPIGGVHIMLLCHPDYPKIESEAKMVAEDLGIDRIWNDVTFRKATKEDEKTIQLALDNEEAINGNGDWAVKLGINLFYSANLSHSPLYIKQMPYNSVLYNAFGRSSPSFSSRKTEVYERRTGKQKRVVAGKWCGKVWMSNQVHPFLAKKDREGEYEEENDKNDDENDKSFFAWSMPNEKSGRKSETSTATTRKAPRKRKLTSSNLTNKKAKRVEPETVIFSEDLMEEDDHRPHSWRKQRTIKKPKFVEKEEAFSEDIEGGEEGNLCGQHRRNSMSKHVTYFETNDDVVISENSLGENEDAVSDQSHGYNDDHYRQYRRIPRTKQAKWTEREKEAVSDDSLGDEEESHLKSKQTKWNNNEDVDFSDEDSMEYDSHEQVHRGTRGKWIQGDDDMASDDLLRDRRIPERKWIERGDDFDDDDDDVASNYSLGDDPHQQGRRFPRKKQRDGGAILSDESMHNTNSSQHYKRVRRSKQMKIIEKEERFSDDLIENASNQHNTTRRSLRRKPAKSDFVLRAGSSIQAKLRSSRSSKSKNTSRFRLFDSDAEEEEKEQDQEDEEEGSKGGPSTRPRKRTPKPVRKSEDKPKEKKRKQPSKKKVTNRKEAKMKGEEEEDELGYVCDIDGCSMSFRSKNELVLHKKNICPLKGCGKKLFSHKYLVQHRRVHVDERPLKCPWKGCKMSFKWAWARTEHIRVHTGARPYVCSEPGCGQTFRFVSDFSRHKRKTGHSVKKGRK